MTSTKYAAEIVISIGSTRVAGSVCAALSPDFGTLSSSGENAKIRHRGQSVVINFESGDLASLRASLNSAILLAGACIRCLTL